MTIELQGGPIVIYTTQSSPTSTAAIMTTRLRHGFPRHVRPNPVLFPLQSGPEYDNNPERTLTWRTDTNTTYTSSADPTSQSSLNGTYEPSLRDVQAVSGILDNILVPDLTPTVLELARYWVRETAAKNTQLMVTEHDAGRMYIKTRPIGWSTLPASADGMDSIEQDPETREHVARHVKMIVFTIRSHDQGWSDYREDYGTYRNSHTWFTASVKRPKKKTSDADEKAESVESVKGKGFDRASNPEDEEEEVIGTKQLVTNVHCAPRDNTHTVTWSLNTDGTLIVGDNPQPTEQQTQQDDAKTETQPEQYSEQERQDIVDLLRSIQEGDTIEVNVFAKFLGWKNNVAGARVDVYCGV